MGVGLEINRKILEETTYLDSKSRTPGINCDVISCSKKGQRIAAFMPNLERAMVSASGTLFLSQFFPHLRNNASVFIINERTPTSVF